MDDSGKSGLSSRKHYDDYSTREFCEKRAGAGESIRDSVADFSALLWGEQRSAGVFVSCLALPCYDTFYQQRSFKASCGPKKSVIITLRSAVLGSHDTVAPLS